MRLRFLLPLVLGVLFSTSGHSTVTVDVEGALTTSDFLATEGNASFYYDAFELRNDSGSPITVAVSLSSNDFAPWLGAWLQNVLPNPNWDDDFYNAAADFRSAAVGESASISFVLGANALAQLAVATYEYNPTNLGLYTLTIPDGVNLRQIPEPAITALFALGLASLRLSGRRRGVVSKIRR
jgi:hypothetical protein